MFGPYNPEEKLKINPEPEIAGATLALNNPDHFAKGEGQRMNQMQLSVRKEMMRSEAHKDHSKKKK